MNEKLLKCIDDFKKTIKDDELNDYVIFVLKTIQRYSEVYAIFKNIKAFEEGIEQLLEELTDEMYGIDFVLHDVIGEKQ
jgi:hypothetical protein